MPRGTNTAPIAELELTLEEQWILHQAFFDYITVAVWDDTGLPQPIVEISLLEKIEDGIFTFTSFELDRLRYECDHHARSEYAPEIDRAPAQSVIKKIDRLAPVDIGR